MKKGVRCLIILLILIFAGCQGKDEGDLTKAPPGPGGVTIGMTKAEVQEAMLEEVRKLQMVGRVKNPYAMEFRKGSDGQIFEVMLYYTGLKVGDNQVSDDELVPVILEDGKVVGWGWGYLNQVVSNQ